MNKSPYCIHWFRRDLRVAGNPALQRSWKEYKGRVLGFFCFDPTFLARSDFSPNRFAFFLKTLQALKTELQRLGGDLLVLDQGPDTAFAHIFELLKSGPQGLPVSVSCNRDYEPFARVRDARLASLCNAAGLRMHTERDHLLIEPHEVLKDDNEGTYQIYSPYARRWFALFQNSIIQERIQAQRKGLEYLERQMAGSDTEPLFSLRWTDVLSNPPADKLERYESENARNVSIKIPAAGSVVAYQALKSFVRDRVQAYAERRDFPAIDGTSQLSIYLKNGSLTSAQIAAALQQARVDFKGKDGITVFLKEIVWREFYYYILFHNPRVENESFLSKYQNLAWENREDYFDAWKEGRTGYPIVDAGMRQLNTTGWMHNRLRMIVASFLTKDLLISWQWGERYFMEKLLDGDLAPNNGGWQWAASTGCDPQPYFRIFNPLLQSEKFDASGEYIRAFVPELRNVKDKQIHAPHDRGATAQYPAPIVDHREQKERAIDLYERD